MYNLHFTSDAVPLDMHKEDNILVQKFVNMHTHWLPVPRRMYVYSCTLFDVQLIIVR